MLERIERQQGNSILTNSSITLHKELDIQRDIKRTKHDKERERE